MGKADITRTENDMKPMNLCFIDENTYPTAKGEWEKAATHFMLIPKVVRDQAGNPVDTEPMLRLLPDAGPDGKPHDQYRLGTGNQAMVAHVGYFQNDYSLGLSFIDYKDTAEDIFFREHPHLSTPARYLLDRLTVESQRNPALLRFHNPGSDKRQTAIRFAMTKFVPVMVVSGGYVYGPKGEVKTRPTPAILQLTNQAYVSLMKVLCNQRVNWSGYWNPENMDSRETLV